MSCVLLSLMLGLTMKSKAVFTDEKCTSRETEQSMKSHTVEGHNTEEKKKRSAKCSC